MKKKILKTIIYAFLIIIIIILLFIKPNGYGAYQQKSYYQQTKSLAEGTEVNNKDNVLPLQGGWAKENITPPSPAHLMGYGYKGDYTQVHDSTYVRTVVFRQGTFTVAFVSYDLMMVHPDVTKAVEAATASLNLDGIYFTAVHTHNGFGEWASGLSGLLIAGGYDNEIVERLAQATKTSIAKATASLSPIEVSHRVYAFPELMVNRLVDGGRKDSLLRVVALKKQDGSLGLINSFAAHATFVDSKLKDLSADYPGALVQLLEEDAAIDFAMFAAGGVGSHAPQKGRTFSYQNMQNYARKLTSPVLEDIHLQHFNHQDTTSHLRYASLPVTLGEAQFKIDSTWRLRPWLFNGVFGELHPELKVLQVNDVVFASFPGDFSGMLTPQLLHPQGLFVVPTSFNGSYIGYIIPDQYYQERDSEAKEMNWFGPYTGSYLVELTNILIGKLQ